MCTCWLFTQLGNGQFSHDDRCFFPSNEGLGLVVDHISLLHRSERKVIRCCEGEANTTLFAAARARRTLFLVDGMVAAVVCWRSLRVQWLEEARRDAGGLGSLPDFISQGSSIIPTSRVTALVEGKEAWATELGTHAAVTRSITRGQPVKPRIVAPSQQTALRNHPSWVKDEDAKRALGPSSQVAGHRRPGVCCVGRSYACSAVAERCRPQGHCSVLWAHNGRALR